MTRAAAVEEETDNVFGIAVRTAREVKRLSVRQAARDANLSEARWRQIENGYQVVARNHRVPVRPSARTVRAIAEVVGLDLVEAFEKAGVAIPDDIHAATQLEVDLPRHTGPDLATVTTDALLEELAKRARASNPGADR